MSCITVFRTTCGYLNRTSTILSRQGHAHCFLEHRLVVGDGASATWLLTPRHFASISKACGPQNLGVKSIGLRNRETNDLLYSVSRYFCQENTESELSSSVVNRLKDRTLRRFKAGYTQVPEERDVTSLPPEINLDNAQYIAVDVKTLSGSSDSDPVGIYAVSDTEQFIKICRNRGLRDYHRISMGLECDENGNIRSSNGQLIETVEPQEAMQELLKFIKKYDNPFLLVYDGPPNAVHRLRHSYMRCGLYEEFISVSPFFIDVFHMARTKIPARIVPSYKLEDLCMELVDMDVNNDPASRVTGMKRLFTDALLQKGFSPIVKCTDYYEAKDCYAKMVVENGLHPLVVEKLAGAGFRLDHLKFLKEQGYEEFEKQMKKLKIFDQDIGRLFVLVKKL